MPPATSVSRVAAMTAGVPVTPCTPSATASLPEGVMTSNAVRHEGSGGNDGGRRACVAAVSQHHGASPGEGGGPPVAPSSNSACNDGRSACNHVGRARHGASPGGSEGRRRRWSQEWQRRQRQRQQEGLHPRRPRATCHLSQIGRRPLVTSTSRPAAVTKAGGPAASSFANAMAPFPKETRAATDRNDRHPGEDQPAQSQPRQQPQRSSSGGSSSRIQ